MISAQLKARAEALGAVIEDHGSRAEVRKGAKLLAFSATPEKAIELAEKRAKEDNERLELPTFLKRGDPACIVKPTDTVVRTEVKDGKLTVATVAPAAEIAPSAAPIKAPPLKRSKARGLTPPITVKAPAPKVGGSPKVKVETAKEATPLVQAPGKAKKKKSQIKGSIVKKKYREAYKKNGFSCGDQLSEELKLYLIVPGQIGICLKRLRAVAEKNDCWRDTYAKLNAGQMRMTIGNRLRAKMEMGDDVDIGGVVLRDEQAVRL